ncbi:MAG: MerC domain-containing protein [Bacteroidetes bacterium]|nr:MerC domain-containing protein [Bacteroidota bacterium]
MKDKKSIIERIGVIGLVLTALTSPCCFPLFGIALSALGFGSFELFGGITMYIFLGFVILSVIGSWFSYFYHKKWLPLLIAMLSCCLIFYNFYFDEDSFNTLYIGMFGLMITSLMNYYETKIFNLMKNQKIILQSTITCPHCGHKKEETMPTDACQYFYECENCKKVLKPKEGDCCVYCSYGTVPCPPIQENKNCCS